MKLSKVLWVLLSLCCYCVIINNNGVEGSHEVHPQYISHQAARVTQLHRTSYHFQPPQNWINGMLIILIDFFFFLHSLVSCIVAHAFLFVLFLDHKIGKPNEKKSIIYIMRVCLVVELTRYHNKSEWKGQYQS